MLAGLNHVADRCDLTESQTLHHRARATGAVVERASAVGADPGVVAGRGQSQNSERRRQRHGSSRTLDRAQQAPFVRRARNSCALEIEARDAQQGEYESQDCGEHCDTPFEAGHANAHRLLPVFLVDRDDVANPAADPTERRAARDVELRKQVWISTADDLLPDPVVVRPSTTMRHVPSKPRQRLTGPTSRQTRVVSRVCKCIIAAPECSTP